MTTDQILQLVAQGGIGLAALAVIGKIAWRVAERMIAAIDALVKEVKDTSKANVDALARLTERLSRIEGEILIGAAASGGDFPENETSEVRRARGEYGLSKPPRR